MDERKRLLVVTAGNLRQSHFYIRDHYDFFPPDCIGPARKTAGPKETDLEILLEGLNEVVKTDIGTDSKTGKPRGFFRRRTWVRRFFRHHNVSPGDKLALERLGNRRYRLSVDRPHVNGSAPTVEFLADIGRVGPVLERSHGRGAFLIKSIELFAGAGGLAFGTAEAGFDHKFVVEWDENACGTLRKNRDQGVRHVREWDIIEEDVSKLDFESYRDQVDFVCGGPPCQPFSLGGKHKGQLDYRNLFPQAK